MKFFWSAKDKNIGSKKAYTSTEDTEAVNLYWDPEMTVEAHESEVNHAFDMNQLIIVDTHTGEEYANISKFAIEGTNGHGYRFPYWDNTNQYGYLTWMNAYPFVDPTK